MYLNFIIDIFEIILDISINIVNIYDNYIYFISIRTKISVGNNKDNVLKFKLYPPDLAEEAMGTCELSVRIWRHALPCY